MPARITGSIFLTGKSFDCTCKHLHFLLRWCASNSEDSSRFLRTGTSTSANAEYTAYQSSSCLSYQRFTPLGTSVDKENSSYIHSKNPKVVLHQQLLHKASSRLGKISETTFLSKTPIYKSTSEKVHIDRSNKPKVTVQSAALLL